jgi:dihydrodipicolinate synthase/N-acetylneuraminate lyase
MPCGTTGEAALLSDEEVAEVVRATCAAARGRVPVLAHVGRPGTAPTLELARRAVADGAAAVAAVVPYYYPLGSDALRAHYAALVEGLDRTPVYAYTIPDWTHNELGPDLLGQLIGDGLGGLKDSTKSIERHRAYAAAVASADAKRFELLMGTASLVLEALRGGSTGAVLALANVEPERCVEQARAFREGRAEDAEALRQELAAAERELLSEGVIRA